MSLINIGGSTDAAYRYKMPRVMNKIEGRGNGIKTVVPNMSAVAAALNRPASLPTKYLGVELGAQSKYDKATDRAVVNGAFPADVLQEHINGFVDKFVLCPNCKLPETELVIKTKSQTIVHKCAACGSKSPVDMTHKLCTFILKDAGGSKKDKKKDKKKEKKKEKKKDKEGKGGDKETDKERKKREKKEKKERKKREKELAKAAGVDPDAGSSSSDEDGLSGSGVAAPSAGAAAGGDGEEDPEADGPVARLDSMVVDDKSAIESAVAALRVFMEENVEDANGIYQKARELQTNSALQMEDRVKVYYLAAFGNQILEQTKDTRVLSPLATIIASVSGDRTKTDLFEATLLDCIEEHLTVTTPALLPLAPLVIKNLYDVAILEEESVVAWWERPTTMHSQEAMIRSRVRPFVEWLQAAEVEPESDTEDDAAKAKAAAGADADTASDDEGTDSGEESDLLADGDEAEADDDDE